MQKINHTILNNFIAFTKLYGYIRYFHPSDEVASIDWNKFAVHGFREIEKCTDTESFQPILKSLFKTIAPALKLHKKNEIEKYDLSIFMPGKTDGLKVTAWQHNGVQNDYLDFAYRSCRINKPQYFYGAVGDYIPGLKYRGCKLKIKAIIKADLKNEHDYAGLFIRIDRRDGRKQDLFSTFNSPIRKNEWNEYELTCVIDSFAVYIFTGISLFGAGTIWVDKFRVYALINNKWDDITPKNFDFEKYDVNKDPGTLIHDDSVRYSYLITESGKSSGTKSLEINCSLKNEELLKLYDEYPGIGEVITKELNKDISCSFPAALYFNKSGTIPKADDESYNKLFNDLEQINENELSGNEKAVRLAGICIAWNTLQHFFPYFDVIECDWNIVLSEFLKKAYDCKDEIEFHDVLKLMAAELDDGHAGVSFSNFIPKKFPSIKTEFACGKAVISKIYDDKITGLKAGDVIIDIDDVSAESKIMDLFRYVSGSTRLYKQKIICDFLLLSGIETELKLLVEHTDGSRDTVITERNLDQKNYLANWFDSRQQGEKISEIKVGIVYINLGISTMEQINEAMPLLESAKGIIFDLRGYPNSNHDIIAHLIDNPVKSALWNIPKVIYPDKRGNPGYLCEGIWSIEPEKPRLKAKVIFITGPGAISYAESFMNIIEYYKIAEIVGEPTAGTNGNINHIYLPGNYCITFTGMRVLRQDGSVYHGKPVQPTVPVSKTINGIREGRDEFLDKAIEIIESN